VTERSISVGPTPNIAIRAGKDAIIEGWDEARIVATTLDTFWGLKIAERKGAKGTPGVIEVNAGGSCTVRVPVGSSVTVHVGHSARVTNLSGSAYVFAGADATVSQVRTLAKIQAGRDMFLEGDEVETPLAKYNAGRHLRFHLRHLQDVLVKVKEGGGDAWEATFGQPRKHIELHAGGEVTIVTDQIPTTTLRVIGRIEKPETLASPP
jgi:hypothetical protein